MRVANSAYRVEKHDFSNSFCAGGELLDFVLRLPDWKPGRHAKYRHVNDDDDDEMMSCANIACVNNIARTDRVGVASDGRNI